MALFYDSALCVAYVLSEDSPLVLSGCLLHHFALLWVYLSFLEEKDVVPVCVPSAFSLSSPEAMLIDS